MVLKAGNRCPNIVTGALVGGEYANHGKSRLRKGVTIPVGTHGRIIIWRIVQVLCLIKSILIYLKNLIVF